MVQILRLVKPLQLSWGVSVVPPPLLLSQFAQTQLQLNAQPSTQDYNTSFLLLVMLFGHATSPSNAAHLQIITRSPHQDQSHLFLTTSRSGPTTQSHQRVFLLELLHLKFLKHWTRTRSHSASLMWKVSPFQKRSMTQLETRPLVHLRIYLICAVVSRPTGFSMQLLLPT